MIFWTAFRVCMANMRQRAKVRKNRWNRCWDITIYRFFQDGGRPPFWICGANLGTTQLVVVIPVQNLVGIALVVMIIQKFEYFARLAWKRLFPPLFGCFEGKNWGWWKLSALLSLYECSNPEVTSCEASRVKKSVLQFSFGTRAKFRVTKRIG